VAVESESELGVEQAVTRAEVVAAVVQLESEVTFARRQLGERGGEGDALISGAGKVLAEEVHHGRSEHVDAEEAEIRAGAEAGDDDLLLGLSGRRLFEDGVNPVEGIIAGNALSANGAELGEQTFAGGLHGGDGALFCLGEGDDLCGAAASVAADVQMVADEMEERLAANEIAGAPDGVAVAARLVLLNEADASGVITGNLRIDIGVAGTDDNADLLDLGLNDLLEEDSQHAALSSVPVDEVLQREAALRGGGCRDDGLSDPHRFLCTIESMAASKTNAVRILESLGIEFELKEYEVDPEDLSAETVATKIGFPIEKTFKTLVARGDRNGVCLAVIPGNASLNLKALAKATGDRSIDTVPLKEVQPLTGYIRGGVTALACKKDFPVIIDEYAQLYDRISVSAGVRGMQILLAPEDYRRAVNGVYAGIAKDKE